MYRLKPTTDNLHKLMAVGGVLLTVSCLIFPAFFFLRTGIGYLALLRAGEEWRVYECFSKKRLEMLDKRKQETTVGRNKLQEQLAKRCSESKVAGNSGGCDKLQSRINEADHKIESIEDASHELSFNLALREVNALQDETLSANRSRDSRFVIVMGWIAAFFCSFVSFIGFRHWWKRVKQFQAHRVAIAADAQRQARTEADKKREQATSRSASPQDDEPTE